MFHPDRLLRRASLLFHRDGTLGSLMESLAAVHADARLVDEPEGRRLTYREAAVLVARWSGGIAAAVGPGDRVVVATPNSYDMLLACLAAARAGAVPVPVNPQMSVDEVEAVTADSDAELVLHDVGRLDDLADGAAPLAVPALAAAGDVAALFYTSGTTGRPKGAALTHRALVGQALPGLVWPGALHRDEAVVSLPIAHIMGFVVLLAMACAGIPVHLLRSFRPDAVLDAIEDRRATIFIGVPAMYRMLLEAGAEGRDLTSVRVFGSGADAMPADLARRFKGMGASVTLPLLGPVGEAAFVEGYGMVEVGGGVAAKVSPPMLDLGLGESLGVRLPGYALRVVDDEGREVGHGAVGELWVRGPGVLKGYWNAPEATAAAVTDDGWLRTGDLARRGPFGSVVFVGRSKDVIKHGGYSVYALEVQEALERHPDVVEAAVLGRPDERLGQVPVAAVRLVPGAHVTGDQIRSWSAEHLAEYKVPVEVQVVDDLPRTGTNKVRKQALLELF